MQFTRPMSNFGAPPVLPAPHGDFRERMAAQFLARTLPSMTLDERFTFEERVAISMFDGNLAEADAIRVALNDYATQRARSKR